MVMITNSDQVMALVRNQLERMSRDKRTGTSRRTAKSSPANSSSASRLKALSKLSSLPQEEFERVLVEALLTSEFGEEVAHDPRFSELVSKTSKLMNQDAALSLAMKNIRAKLQSGTDLAAKPD